MWNFTITCAIVLTAIAASTVIMFFYFTASLLHPIIEIAWQQTYLNVWSHNSFRIAVSSYMISIFFCLRDYNKHLLKIWKVNENETDTKNECWRIFSHILSALCFTCFCKSFIYHQPVGWILTFYIAFASKLKFGFLFGFVIS